MFPIARCFICGNYDDTGFGRCRTPKAFCLAMDSGVTAEKREETTSVPVKNPARRIYWRNQDTSPGLAAG